MLNVYVRLAGGLGNQLFQLAAGIFVARLNNGVVHASLEGLSAYATFRGPDSLRLLQGQVSVLNKKDQSCKNFMMQSMRFGRWPTRFGISDRTFDEATSTKIRAPWVMMDGYFQDVWKQRDLLPIIASLNSKAMFYEDAPDLAPVDCVIHVRGGDFLNIPIHDIVDDDYYVEAVKVAQGAGAVDFWIVTDDPVYAQRLMIKVAARLSEFNHRFHVANEDCLMDFLLIRNAKIKIIGNSTFSWWACALDPHRRLVISPRRFVKGVERGFFLPWEFSVDLAS